MAAVLIPHADNRTSSFNSTDVSDDFSIDDALEQLGDGIGDLQVLDLIGQGAFGAVYKVTWRGRAAALKVIEQEDDGEEQVLSSEEDCFSGTSSAARRKQALLEAAVSSALRSPNIVETYDYQLLEPSAGAITDPLNLITSSKELRILMEWCDAGSLLTALEDGRLPPVGAEGDPAGFEATLATLLEIAQAMQYLHCMHIIHCDLKAKNVLLCSSQADPRGYTAKVSDFGLSKLVADSVGPGAASQCSSEASGTVTHMAPEMLSQGRVSPAADTYAFGILMWETYMGEAPYADLTKMQVMYGVVTENMRPVFPPGAPEWFSQLAIRCWAVEAEDRPTFLQIVLHLREKLAQVRELQRRRASSMPRANGYAHRPRRASQSAASKPGHHWRSPETSAASSSGRRQASSPPAQGAYTDTSAVPQPSRSGRQPTHRQATPPAWEAVPQSYSHRQTSTPPTHMPTHHQQLASLEHMRSGALPAALPSNRSHRHAKAW